MPEFWANYDQDTAKIGITQSKPPDDECSDNDTVHTTSESTVADDASEKSVPMNIKRRAAYEGASNDAF